MLGGWAETEGWEYIGVNLTQPVVCVMPILCLLLGLRLASSGS